MKTPLATLLVSTVFALTTLGAAKPNVLLIVCDDLNGYIARFGGHPQTKTPNIARLADSGMCFQQAHCTIPICAPSRSSFLTGLYPHTSANYGFDKWDQNEVLANSRTLMDHFRANGYFTLGTGKLMHNEVVREWSEWGNAVDYSPFAYNGEENVAHPDVPSPLRDDFGAVDGSLGPLVNVKGRKFKDGKPCSWRAGNWKKQYDLRVDSQDDRDATADERNRDWAVEQLKDFAEKPGDKPFFMGVGFLRPHTPLIVPKRFFDMFPLEEIKLPVIRPGDVEDTFLRELSGKAEDDRDRGAMIYKSLVASYGSHDLALRTFIQAYLACVASVDELVGDMLDVIDNSPLKENTIIIFTSDHGWGMGEKDYVYKNSLWEESTRVPLIVRVPGVTRGGAQTRYPVSLVDLYPTLIDLCGLTGDTVKNAKGRPLDGHSLAPFLRDPKTEKWDGPDAALTALFRWSRRYDPARQSYALRSKDWRYIRYSNGKEELYDHRNDPHEWTNLATNPEFAPRLREFREQLAKRLPEPSKDTGPAKSPDEEWKDGYFENHPDADTNKDGKLTWAEYNAHRGKPGGAKPKNKKTADEAWKDKYFGWHPDADTDKDGKLSWQEYKAHKTALDAKKAEKKNK